MAIRHRKDKASPWQVYWNNPFTGKRESQSYATREEAEKEESLIKHRMRFERDSFRRQEEDIQPEELTLEGVYFQYLKQKQFNLKTLLWQRDAMRFPLEAFRGVPVSDITKKDIEELMERMLRNPVKPVTVRNRLSVLRTVLRWGKDNGLIGHIDFPKLPPARYEKFVPPTPEELESIVSVAPPHIVRVVVIGSQMGVRIGKSELCRLTWSDVDISQRVIRVQAAKKNPNMPWREIPIRESLVGLFRTWKEEDAKLGIEYVINWKGKQVASIKTAWASTLHTAGITRRIRPYDLRHAFATYMIGAGVDIGTVARLMGHNSPAMLLQHYQHVMDDQKRRAVEALPDVFHVPVNMCPKEKAPTAMQ